MTKPKILFWAIVVAGVFYFSNRAYVYVKEIMGENKRLHTELVGQKESYKQLSDYAAKLAVEYSDEAKMKEELERQFSAEKEALQGRIKILSNATFMIREAARKAGHSDVVYQGQDVKYVVNEVRFNSGPPVGYVLIFDDGRVISKLYNHVIDVKTAVARDEDSGRYSIVSRADYTLKSPSINLNGEKNWVNQPYPLKIVEGTAFVDPTEKNQLVPKLHWWAPHVNGGLSLGVGALGTFLRPTMGISLAGHGSTRNDLIWKFVHLGFDSDTEFKAPGFHLIPFSYRFWPNFLSNSYIGPGLGFGGNGTSLHLNLNLTL